MKERSPACVALAFGISLSLGILRSGLWYVVLNMAQPSPAHARTVDGGSLADPDTTGCAGDCTGDGQVTVDELLGVVNIALGKGQLDGCAVTDLDHNQQITVDEIVAAVENALNACPSAPTPTATPTEAPTKAPTAAPTATATITPGGPLTVAEAIARNSGGVAIHLNQNVTTEGTATVAAGILANKKLKVFAQDGRAGIMVYYPDSGGIRAFQPGDRLAVRGKIVQADPGGENVLTGTVMIDISVSGALATVLSSGNALPAPLPATLHDIAVNGFGYMGALVRVPHVQKVAGNWPILGGQTTSVTVSDDGGTTQLPLRFQKNTITPQLVSKLNAIGNGPFDVVAIAVQNAVDNNLMANFEIWIRGADDVTTP